MGVPASDQDIHRLAKLADLLENDAVDLGFLGPNEGQRVVSRHIFESAALVPFLPSEGPIVDVGSGAGLPGLVLAALGLEMVLIDALEKRANFLRDVASQLAVDVDVRAARAEDEGRGPLRDSAAAAVARALAAPTVALELCLPFVRPGGRLAVLASPDAEAGAGDRSGGARSVTTEESATAPGKSDDETVASSVPGPTGSPVRDGVGPTASKGAGTDDARARARLAEDVESVSRLLGGGGVSWQPLSVPGADAPRWVMIVDKRGPTPKRFPRRPGVPKRRPLGGDVASVN